MQEFNVTLSDTRKALYNSGLEIAPYCEPAVALEKEQIFDTVLV